MLPTKFWFIWPSGFRGEDFKKSAIQKQELPVVAMFGNGVPLDIIVILLDCLPLLVNVGEVIIVQVVLKQQRLSTIL
jgi:hypothetical protein